MEEAVIRKLIKTAVRQLSYSYAPYSHFKVRGGAPGRERNNLYRMQY